MKDQNMILSLIIQGRIASRNNIYVYLLPLVDDLNELWNEGIITYNSSTKKIFQLHASLLWIINDFLAYENLFGYSTKGKLYNITL
jgi:hypothetical protein